VLKLRPATREDAAEVSRVHVRSWQVGYQGLLPDDYLDGLRPEERATHYTFGTSEPGVPFTVVAVQETAVVGFATTAADDGTAGRGVGELLALYVDPDHWGTGVGRALVADARARLRRAGSREAVLWVLVGNERAERFYRADGWAPDGARREEEVWGVSADEIRYRRALP
jgi:GNAT superfamily N-acetyltransferase